MNNWLALGGSAALLGLLAAFWRQLRSCYSLLSGYLLVSVDGHEALSYILNAFVLDKCESSRLRQKSYLACTEFVKPQQRTEQVIFETLGNGLQLFWYHGWPLWLTRISSSASTFDQSSVLSRPLRITFFRGTIDRKAFLLEATRYYNALACADDDDTVQRYAVYHLSGTADKAMVVSENHDSGTNGRPPQNAENNNNARSPLGWTREQLGPEKTKGGALTRLALSGKAQQALSDVRRWLKSREWYQERGLAWKFGCLFYGPPGTGKTAAVRGLGEDLNLPIFAFDLPTFHNGELRSCWASMLASTPCIALLEDFDSVCEQREVKKGKWTFDCLLNCIDGVQRNNGVFLIITTNRPETLDPALGGPVKDGEMALRPGRIDRSILFDKLTEEGRRHLAHRILADWPDLWESTIAAGDGDTGAQFEQRCSDLAIRRFWAQNEPFTISSEVIRENYPTFNEVVGLKPVLSAARRTPLEVMQDEEDQRFIDAVNNTPIGN